MFLTVLYKMQYLILWTLIQVKVNNNLLKEFGTLSD